MEKPRCLTLLLTFLPFLIVAQQADTILAREYLEKAGELIDSAKYDEALTFGYKALDIFKERLGEKDTVIASVYHQLGKALREKQDLQEAKGYHEKALGIRLSLLGETHPQVAASYYELGLVNLYKGENDKALEFYQRALDIRLSTFGKDHLMVAIPYNDIGMIHWRKGNYEKALKYHQKALKIKIEALGEDHSQVATSYNNIGLVYWNQGDYDKALEYFQKALKTYRITLGKEHPQVATSYNNVGFVYWRKGDYTRAITFYQTALDIGLTIFGKDHLQVATYYNNIGLVYQDKGDYAKSLEFYQKAQEINLAALGSVHPQVATTYNNIGSVYRNKSDYDKALEFSEKALEIHLATVGKDHPSVANVYTGIGDAYRSKEDYDKALDFHQKALKIRLNKFGEDHPEVATSYFHIGAIYSNIGSYDKALKAHQNGLEIVLAIWGENHPDVANSYYNIGWIYSDKGDYDKALDFHQKALKIKAAILGENHPNVTTSLNSISNVYFLNKKYETALDYAEKAVSALEQVRSQYTSVETKQVHLAENFSIFENAIRTLKTMAAVDPSQFDLQKTFTYSEKAKSNLLLEALYTARAETFAGIPDSLQQREYDLRVDLAHFDKKRFGEQQKGEARNDSLLRIYTNQLFDLRQAYDALIAHFEKNYSDYYRLKYETEVISVPETQKMLEADQALLEYFVGDSTIYAFIITPDDFRMEQIAKDFPLEDWVSDLRRGFSDYHYASNQSETLYRQTKALFVENALNLYNSLLGSLGPLPEKLIIVPDGVLNYVPFEILLTERPKEDDPFKNQSYFFRKHQISYNFSATLWQWMRSRKSQAQNGLLAFAPAFPEVERQYANITVGRRSLGPLRFNMVEAKNIQRQVGGKAISGPEATVNKFRQLAPNYRLLHFATHAKVDDSNVDYSFLAFSETDDSLDHGKIFIRDLYELQLPADMVVLSACETGIGELKRGEGVISLARGFAYAGAKSIVTSLWSVNDQSTSQVMERFYKNLKKGLTKDEALREAKLDYLNTQNDPLYAHPFYWAAFVAIGDMEAVEAGSGVPWLWIVVGLIGLGLLWFFWRSR